jgi:hypothetical protein
MLPKSTTATTLPRNPTLPLTWSTRPRNSCSLPWSSSVSVYTTASGRIYPACWCEGDIPEELPTSISVLEALLI